MSEEQERLWWEGPEATPEQRETVEGLMATIEDMSIAGSKLGTGYMIRMITVLGLVGFNIYIMYLEWGSPQMAFVYIYSIVNIAVGLDALSSGRKLRDIASGKPVKVDKRLPNNCGHCGKPLDYLKEKQK